MSFATMLAPPEARPISLLTLFYIGFLASCYVILDVYVVDELDGELHTAEQPSVCGIV